MSRISKFLKNAFFPVETDRWQANNGKFDTPTAQYFPDEALK
jgi:hypothetical protein